MLASFSMKGQLPATAGSAAPHVSPDNGFGFCGSCWCPKGLWESGWRSDAAERGPGEAVPYRQSQPNGMLSLFLQFYIGFAGMQLKGEVLYSDEAVLHLTH